MDEPMIMSRTLILIDPSSPHGEGGLSMLTADDQAVTLLLTLDGRSAASLHDFAIAEDIDVSMAGLIYLDQVVCRVSVHTDDIETISTSGADAVGEIFHVLAATAGQPGDRSGEPARARRRGLVEVAAGVSRAGRRRATASTTTPEFPMAS